MDAMKIKGSWERKYTANAIREARKPLLRHSACDCSTCESEEMDADEQKFIFPAFAVVGSIILAGILLMTSGCWTTAHASNLPGIPGKQAVLAIIGEAEDQGYTGMLAVACAIRNRGTLKGVYGLNAPRVKKHLYSKETYRLAQKAWDKSGPNYKNCYPGVDCNVDITNGATGWGNAKDGNEFAKTKWWKNCVITFRHGDHFFYKDGRSS